LGQARDISTKFSKENIEVVNKRFFMGAFSNLLNVAGYAAVEIYIILSTLSKKISVGSLTYYTTALINFQNGLSGLFRTASELIDASQYVEEIFEFLDIEPKLVSPDNAIVMKENKAPKIEFRNVTFSYPGSDTKILDNFSIIIEPGEKIAFVGENGAGKTTIVKLICRFYDVDKGEILLDGINIKEVDLVSWYENIGVIFQDFLKYEYSLTDNIWFGQVNKPINDDNIIMSARQSGADSVAKSLDKGYDQMLGNVFDESTELSTGQWQKVALARGFYRNAPVLILDEPTAAIDARAEHEIFRKVEKLTSDKTAIIISHRFSTVRNADKIYVIEHGKLIESGSHKQLMKINGVYADLFNLQAEAYK
jgi:ATP-binding cassette subfamily B protein